MESKTDLAEWFDRANKFYQLSFMGDLFHKLKELKLTS